MKEKRSYLIAGAIVLAIASALFAPALHAADDTYYPVVTPDLTAKVSTKGERIDSVSVYYPVVTPKL